jgi:hypothetical protein
MDYSPKISVMVIENDDDFRGLLNGVFERSEQFVLVKSFGSLEDFGVALLQQNPAHDWFPQLLVADVMSSVNPRVECTSYISALRDEGLVFASLFVSSMNFGALLRVLRKKHPKGWGVLQKNSKLSEKAILDAAFETYADLVRV